MTPASMQREATDPALLERLARILHAMGLPCDCQKEVERTLAVFAAFEDRRARRRLLDGARERARSLRGHIEYLEDLDETDAAALELDDIAAMADVFRVIASTAVEGAAGLEMLASLGARRRD